MNDQVRALIDARMREKGMSRADLARAIHKTPQTVTRALNGNEGGGTVPPLWAAMLDALDLEPTVQPRTPRPGTGSGQEGAALGVPAE